MKWRRFYSEDLLQIDQLVDDKKYLVIWMNEDDRPIGPRIAFWSHADNSFFLMTHPNWPIRVDYFCEITDFDRREKEDERELVGLIKRRFEQRKKQEESEDENDKMKILEKENKEALANHFAMLMRVIEKRKKHD
jgi:hypothetical protein